MDAIVKLYYNELDVSCEHWTIGKVIVLLEVLVTSSFSHGGPHEIA